MPKIYCNYTTSEMEVINSTAAAYGLTPSGLQKHALLLLCRQPADGILPQAATDEKQGSDNDIAALVSQMIVAITMLRPHEEFVVSSLLDPSVWTALNRSQKLTLSQSLSRYAKRNPSMLCYTGRKIGSTKVYARV